MDLKAITSIDLSNNMFTGIIHDDESDKWGMEQLIQLNLSNNKFEGEVSIFVPLPGASDSISYLTNPPL